jgi:hypothetical protein
MEKVQEQLARIPQCLTAAIARWSYRSKSRRDDLHAHEENKRKFKRTLQLLIDVSAVAECTHRLLAYYAGDKHNGKHAFTLDKRNKRKGRRTTPKPFNISRLVHSLRARTRFPYHCSSVIVNGHARDESIVCVANEFPLAIIPETIRNNDDVDVET